MGLETWPWGASTHPTGVARGLLHRPAVDREELIGVKHLQAAGRVIPVELFRNACGTVAARCRLGDDCPIIDGPTVDEVLKAVQDALEGLLFARTLRAA